MLTTTVTGLSWSWIVIMAIAPPAAALLVAYPIWQAKQPILGNLTGSLVIFGSALALIVRESIDLNQLTASCLEAGYTCWPDPSAFARYAIYASIGAVEVFALFSYSLRVERNIRGRGYAPEWR